MVFLNVVVLLSIEQTMPEKVELVHINTQNCPKLFVISFKLYIQLIINQQQFEIKQSTTYQSQSRLQITKLKKLTKPFKKIEKVKILINLSILIMEINRHFCFKTIPIHSIIINMTKHLPFLNRLLQYNLYKGAKLMSFMIAPISTRVTFLVNAWKKKVIPKPNPYELFSSLVKNQQPVKPFEFKEFSKRFNTQFEEGNLLFVRDTLRKYLKNSVSNLKELKQLRNQLYYSSHQQNSNTALKTLIEIDAKLYLAYKQKGFQKQMGQQLDLILISINKFKNSHPEDIQMREFEMNQISCMYEKVNLLKSQKNKSEYIKALQKLYKMELKQEESENKQKYCNRILRRICLHYLMQKNVKPMLDYYNTVQSDSERRIIRYYLTDLI